MENENYSQGYLDNTRIIEKVLIKCLSKDQKDNIINKNKIPSKTKLLEAPKLNNKL